MKDVTHGKIKHRYENKKTYLIHHQLVEMLASGGYMVKINLFLFIGFYLFLREYPLPLATLDLAFTLLAVLFHFVLKPKLLKGEVQGYYRRGYRDVKVTAFLIHFFIKGGIQRFIVMALYYGVSLYLVRGDTREVERYQGYILETVLNPIMWLVAIAVFAFVLYQLLYKEKYTTIREFSNGVVEIFTSYPYNEEGAVNEFIRRKDGELNMFDVEGVKYDGHMAVAQPVTYAQTTPDRSGREWVQEDSSVAVKEEPVHEQVTSMIRRKARK